MWASSGRYPVRTPFLDRLAARGARFENAYSSFPLCCPARQSMLCGVMPEQFGALWNYDITLPIAALPPGGFTYAQQLRAAGYQNAYIGKWHVSPDHTPTQYGYELYEPIESYEPYRRKKGYESAWHNTYLGEIDPVPAKDSRTHYQADRAISLMEQYEKDDRPWHIRLDFAEPHLPCRPSPEFAALYTAGDIPQWDGFADDFAGKPYIQRQQPVNWGMQNYSWQDWAPVAARYYAVISQVDDAVGKVLQALERLGAAENTLVLFTADHGDMCGSHHMMDKHYILYDDVVRIPLLAAWPRVIAPGTVLSGFVQPTLDLAPTLLDACRLEKPDFLQGKSLLPLLRGNAAKPLYTEAVASYNGQQFGLYTQRMVRTEKYKYVWNLTDVDELYDLQADPGELCSRIGDPALASELAVLRQTLYTRLKAYKDPILKGNWVENQLLRGEKL